MLLCCYCYFPQGTKKCKESIVFYWVRPLHGLNIGLNWFNAKQYADICEITNTLKDA